MVMVSVMHIVLFSVKHRSIAGSGQIVFDIDTAGSLSLAEQSQVMEYALRKKDRLFFVNPIVIDHSSRPPECAFNLLLIGRCFFGFEANIQRKQAKVPLSLDMD